jgi:large subunit ribosomal protein L15
MPLYRKLPQRGFNRLRFQTEIAVVNIAQLERLSTEDVNLQTLKDAGLVRSNAKLLKLLGSGETEKVFHVKANYASSSASKKIEAAGGSVSLV